MCTGMMAGVKIDDTAQGTRHDGEDRISSHCTTHMHGKERQTVDRAGSFFLEEIKEPGGERNGGGVDILPIVIDGIRERGFEEARRFDQVIEGEKGGRKIMIMGGMRGRIVGAESRHSETPYNFQ